MPFTTDLREAFYLLGQKYPGFEEVLTQTLFALVAQEHMLWYSKPGRAKSAVAREVFSMFDTPQFHIQLTKDIQPESIFGPMIPERYMKEGVEIINTEGGIVTAVFAYLDEFFDAPDYVLRSMLNILHERIFSTKDMGIVDSPLHSAIATTNFMRQREATDAVLDRILCKAVLPGVTDVTDVMRAGKTYLGFHGKSMPLPKLDYGALLELSEFVQRPQSEGGIVLSPGMRLLHVLLIQEFQDRRIKAAVARWHAENPDAAEEPDEFEIGVPDVSPRTIVKLHDMSRAAAALMDRTTVSSEDLRAIGYGLYVVGDESGDGILWHSLCDEWLGLSRSDRNALEALGEIADSLGTIKAEHSKTTKAELLIGGKLVSAAQLAGVGLSTIVRGARGPAVKAATERLKDELADLANNSGSRGFNLLKGW